MGLCAYASPGASRGLSRRRALALTAAGGAAAVVAACGSRRGNGSAGAPASANAGQPRYGGSLNVPISTDIYDFDVSLGGKEPPNPIADGLAYETLLTFKSGPGVAYDDTTIVPSLAARWEIPDAQTYIFHLTPGARFAPTAPVNGRALTAEDVKWSFEYIARAGDFKTKNLKPSNYGYMLQGLDRIETPDQSTAGVHFAKPFAPFLTYTAITPLSIMPHEIFDADGSLSDRIAGSGAFQLDVAGSQKGTRWVFKRNGAYWRQGKPYLDQVVCLVLPDPETAYAAFQTKRVDVLQRFGASGADLTVIPSIKKANPNAQNLRYPTPGSEGLYLSYRKPPFNDPRMRRAFSLAIDRDEFDRVFAGGASGWVMPESLSDDFSQQEIKQILQYDPAQARQLLAAAGAGDGIDAEYLIRVPGEVLQAEVELLQSQLKRVGINMTIKNVDGATGTQRLHTGDFQITPGAKAVDVDLDSRFASYYSASPTNFIGIKDTKLDAMIDAQRQEADRAKRQAEMRDIIRYMAANSISFALYRPVSYTFWQPYLKNYVDHWDQQNFDAANIWLEK